MLLPKEKVLAFLHNLRLFGVCVGVRGVSHAVRSIHLTFESRAERKLVRKESIASGGMAAQPQTMWVGLRRCQRQGVKVSRKNFNLFLVGARALPKLSTQSPSQADKTFLQSSSLHISRVPVPKMPGGRATVGPKVTETLFF